MSFRRCTSVLPCDAHSGLLCARAVNLGWFCFPFTWQRVEGEDVSLKPWWLWILRCSWVDTNEEFKPNLVAFVQNVGLEMPYIHTIITAISFWVIILFTSLLFFLRSLFFNFATFWFFSSCSLFENKRLPSVHPMDSKTNKWPTFYCYFWGRCLETLAKLLGCILTPPNTSLPICVDSSLVLKQVLKKASQYNHLLPMTFCACAFANIG